MENFTQRIRYGLFILFLSFLTSCGGDGSSEFWTGEAGTEEEKMAKQACDCMGDTYKEKGIDVDKLMKSIPELVKDRNNMKEDEFNAKHADPLAELKKARAIELDKSECGKKVHDEIAKMTKEKKISQKKMQAAMLAKCKLAGF